MSACCSIQGGIHADIDSSTTQIQLNSSEGVATIGRLSPQLRLIVRFHLARRFAVAKSNSGEAIDIR